MGCTSGAINLGTHVEGPFVNKARVGAHAISNLRTFDEVITFFLLMSLYLVSHVNKFVCCCNGL